MFFRLCYSPFLAQMVVIRRCNLSCGYCSEYDKTSDPVPVETLEERLRWAVLYAALSVRVATAVAGAVTLRALLEEGAEHGLASPVRQPSAAMKEDQ